MLPIGHQRALKHVIKKPLSSFLVLNLGKAK